MDRRRQNRRSAAQEAAEAKLRGGKVQPGSGSSWRAPGDVKVPSTHEAEGQLVEMKFTDKESFSLKVKDGKAIVKKAMQNGLAPEMIVDFPQHGYRAVIRWEVL